MNQKHLKDIRLVLAVVALLLFTACFLPVGKHIPFIYDLARLQVVPALISSSWWLVLVLFILTIFLGRIYCSILCPLGLLQDFIMRVEKLFRKKRRFIYSKPKTILRYSIFAATILSWFVGISVVLTLLDPYSSFGRIVTNLFRPVYTAVNNLVALAANAFGYYGVYHVSLQTISVSAAITAGVTLLLVAILSVRYGRLYCNAICPVGTGLGLISKLSLFKIKLNNQHCTSCTLCATKCKSQCINADNMQVDETRCVSCYNCLAACRHNAISLQWTYKAKVKSQNVDKGKRRAIIAGALAAVAIPKAVAQSKAPLIAPEKLRPIMPPGAGNLKHFQSKCTACHLCVSTCPSQVIKPSFLEYGLAGMFQPYLDYKISFCTYECTLCSEVCPNNALQKITSEEKKHLQIGKATFERERCVVYRDETDCGACSEHCPTQAVHMIPYKNGLRIPEVTQDICVGCGGCQYICPVMPMQAIYVQGNSEQAKVHIAKEKKQEEKKIDDFGF